MTLNAKIKAAIDSQFDAWHKQLNNKSVTLEEILDIIGIDIYAPEPQIRIRGTMSPELSMDNLR